MPSQVSMYTIIIIEAFCLIYSFYPALAWWDEGHMISGAIARRYITAEQAEKIDNYLAQWGFQYPGFTNMEMACIWPDHIKCSTNTSPGCLPFSFADDFTLFNHWHYEDKPYIVTPFEMPLSKHHEDYNPGAEAVFQLRKILSNVATAKAHPCTETECPLPIGTAFSWNFRIRMFMHIFGDLHQPNHAGDGWSPNFPKSDFGASLFTIPNGTMTFHQFMDSGAGLWVDAFPIATVEKIRAIADDLIDEFSHIIDDYLNITSPMQVAEESFEHLSNIYNEINFPQITKDGAAYFPEGFEEHLKDLCKKRIVATGRRLAVHMANIAEVLPPLNYPPQKYIKEIEISKVKQEGSLSQQALLVSFVILTLISTTASLITIIYINYTFRSSYRKIGFFGSA